MALAKTNTKIYESEAGKELNMQIVTAGNTEAPYSVAHGGNYYAFVGYGESSIQYSTDGEAFQTAFLSFNAYDVIYSESKEAFIIAGSRTVSSNNCPIIVSTVDFQSFTTLYNPGEITDNIGFIYGIFEIGSSFFALANTDKSGYSFASVTFDSSFSVGVTKFTSSAEGSVRTIIKGNNRFLVEARFYRPGLSDSTISNYSITISGGTSSVVHNNSDIEREPKLLGFANGYFFNITSGYSKKSLNYSIDGITWNTIIDGINEALNTVVYLNREYLFICEGKICKRKDIGLTVDDEFKAVTGLPKTGPGVVANNAAFLLGSNIIKLSVDDPDPTVEAEKLSATQALDKAKKYADQLYAALDARVSALEGN